MQEFDALIVGGGPAGSSCARQLRRQGLDVVLIDKSTFPRDKVCAGWITPGVIDTLELDTAAYATENVLQPITGFRTGTMSGGVREIRYANKVSYGIRRREFDDYLLRRSGARLLLGETLESLERSGGKWVANGKIAAPVVVGAGGHFCPVARLVGAKLGAAEPIVAAKEIEIPLSAQQLEACSARGDTPELRFCDDFKGYGWCFLKGNYLNVGLGRETNRDLAEHISAFCDALKRRGTIPADVDERFRGHAYLLYGHGVRNPVHDGVLLVGDAVGLAYPQSGEGIRPAIESGLMAAATIIEAQGDYRRERLDAYRQRLIQRYGAVAGAPAPRDPNPLRSWVATMLLNNGWFARRVVLDRWFLHADQTALSA